ncbi:hypothetical protein B0I37DRAFT_368322 [Chaetomium sp. MPI-CAGE-AT-0009]|nr:hypothetical protein B0I37DRAFT_368322 [Chaetomium sp. MPI-CAGE-AT-0009]
MRSSFTATGLFLLLNVPTFTNGLPHSTLEAPDAGASASALASPPPSLVVPGARTAAGHDIAASSNDGGEGSLESRLELELAELKALRAQLASLAKEVDTRALRLATSVGPTDRSALADCDSPACILRAVRRKAGYAVEALRLNRGDGDDGGGYLSGQQRRRRRRQDVTDSYPEPEPQGGVVEGLDLLIHRLLLCILAVFTVQHVAIGAGLMLLCFAVLWCGSICRDALGKAMSGRWRPWRAREGRIRLGDEEAVDWGLTEKGEERLDEKQSNPGEEERNRDEKAGFDEERYRHEYVSSWVEDVEVVEAAEDNDIAGGDEEPLTLGDEIASFRSALELVENMVAATEERHRGRTDYRAF